MKHWSHFSRRLNMLIKLPHPTTVKYIHLILYHSKQSRNDTLLCCLSQCAIYTVWWFGQRETTWWRVIHHRQSCKKTGNTQWSGLDHPCTAFRKRDSCSLIIKGNNFYDLQHLYHHHRKTAPLLPNVVLCFLKAGLSPHSFKLRVKRPHERSTQTPAN